MASESKRLNEIPRSAAPPRSSRALIRRIVAEHLRPHLGRVLAAVLMMSLAAAATAGNAWLMEPVLDDVFVKRDHSMLVLIPLVVIALALVKGFAAYGQAVTMNHVGQRIIADLQARLFAHLMRADLAFFHDNPTGRLISRLTNDVNLMRAAVAQALTGMVKDALTVIFLVALMFYQSWWMALVAFFAFPIAILPIVKLGRRMRKVSSRTQGEQAQFMTLLDETFQGIRHVKAYGMEAREGKRVGETIEALFQLVLKAARTRSASHPIMETLGSLAIAAVIFVGGSQVIAGTTTPGTFFSFITALLLAYQPVKSLASLNANLQEGLAAAERVFAVLDTAAEIQDRPGAATLEVPSGEIRFEQVAFAYRGRPPVLAGLNLVLPAGRTVALVGASGAGKSTIVNLLPRFYEVDAGRVLIDGVDVRDVTLASLRQHIALVSQEVSLFHDTIRANIAYGTPDASDAEIEAAARLAGADAFIRAQPEGYATVVGERGVKLSGGQRQRIAIARAILRNAPILLLDEATSALDIATEREVQAALATLMKGRTTLVVAHRLATVVDADIICVVAEGRIVEQGRHAELLARGGAYARLYAMQSEGENGVPRHPRVVVGRG